MTFEEFFNKKRIDLVALRAAEPGLFAEFEKHFTQMGEKSFDHTKKYWFNKLRLQYHLAPELKPEKIHLENQLAEQTIVETLTDSIPAPSTGFKPRFKPGIAGKPAEPATVQKETPATELQPVTPAAETPAESTAPKPGFKPRFNAKMAAAPMPAETKEIKPEAEPTAEAVTPPESTAPKPGFKPRFNMKMAAPKPVEADEAKPEAEPAAEATATQESTTPKPGFKPRFNMKTMAAKPAEAIKEEKAQPEQVAADNKKADVTESTPATEEAPAAPKVGFKPRFNATTTKPQPPQE